MNMSAERLQILGDNKGPESKELNIKKYYVIKTDDQGDGSSEIDW